MNIDLTKFIKKLKESQELVAAGKRSDPAYRVAVSGMRTAFKDLSDSERDFAETLCPRYLWLHLCGYPNREVFVSADEAKEMTAAAIYDGNALVAETLRFVSNAIEQAALLGDHDLELTIPPEMRENINFSQVVIQLCRMGYKVEAHTQKVNGERILTLRVEWA